MVINFEDKQINCENFDIDMKKNIAVAYNNVIVTDPKSVMNAGKIVFDMATKDINITPGNKEKVNVVTK